MYVSVTGLKAKGFLAAIRFWLLAVPAFKQAKSSGGVLFCEVKSVGGFHHTLTSMENQKGYAKICPVTDPPESNEDFSQDRHRFNNWL
jgi:hypothetical protein